MGWNMSSYKRDLCWLAGRVDAGRYFRIEGIGNTPVTTAIRREMRRLFVKMAEADCTAGQKEDGICADVVLRLCDGQQSKEEFDYRQLGDEGYHLRSVSRVKTDVQLVKSCETGEADARPEVLRDRNGSVWVIEALTDRGLLYGMYGLYRLLGKKHVPERDLLETCDPIVSVPAQSIRMVNHWDNFDGTVERGYAGESIFYEGNTFRHVKEGTGILEMYAGLLASVGINTISLNNVNVHEKESRFITREYTKDLCVMAEVFREYGIRCFLSVNFAAPISVGGLSTADPADADVRCWWRERIDELYSDIPDFGGLLVKADSEGNPGPFTYGRGHEDGANMFAELLAPHGGMVIWRCFVYNCRQNWWERHVDRAKAAYDIFQPLDGRFADNVSLQIKNGPIDFQIREPVSPLFGAMGRTNQIIEFQITQEYTGHDIDLCYLVPMWKEVLEWRTQVKRSGLEGIKSEQTAGTAAVRDVIRQNSPCPEHSGMAAVVNVGMDSNWTGHKMAQANLFGYGRLCWDSDLSADEIASEWARLSFPMCNARTIGVMTDMLVTSRETYENYTCPLAVGFMCSPHRHYGVDIDGYEYDRWGTYHYADRDGIGRDRTCLTGTGFTGQYGLPWSSLYESTSECPDELLLFFHHVPYTHRLRSGKTVIQHIYDTHFEGVNAVEQYIKMWDKIRGDVPGDVYTHVRERLSRQLENARAWRDTVNTYFYRKSGIADEKSRKIHM